ncbi:MAG: tetratricopeptide repeat protein [Candidatus Melainabacteria bacterium]|nr:tetratricopeptide repeat protein [Candidatus Melainabacteria bacterium]
MRVFIILLLLIGLRAPAQAVEPRTARDPELSRIESLVNQGSLIKARRAVESVLSEQPGNIEARLLAARIYKAMGLWSRSILEYESIRSEDPDLVEPYVALSQMHLENLSADLSLSLARQAVRLAPDSKEARVALISGLIATHEYSDADRELEALIKRFPADAAVLYMAFQLYRDNGEFKEARDFLRKAIKANPDRIAWLLDLYDVCESLGDIKSAEQAVELYLTKAPSSVEALEKLALLQENYLYDYVLAGRTYDKILAIDPENWNALAGKDRIEIRQNDLAMSYKRRFRHLWASLMNRLSAWLDSFFQQKEIRD